MSPFSFSFLFFLSLLPLYWGAPVGINGGEAESTVRYMASLTNITLQDIIAHSLIDLYGLTEVQGIFLRENSTYTPPYRVAGQLPNFGSTIPWNSVMDQLNEDNSKRLFFCIRHGQAWENKSPDNRLCYWNEGDTIERPVFDSPLDFRGFEQTARLNDLFGKPANKSDGKQTWFEALNLGSAKQFNSPITRAMQTSNNIFSEHPIERPVTVSDLLRAGLNGDRCNYRRPISTPTETIPLPTPWDTGCDYTNNSLTDLWRGETFYQLKRADMGLAEIWSGSQFEFNIRPAGASYPGIMSDVDEQWRSDYFENDVQLSARIGALIVQIFQAFPQQKIFSVTTHSEVCSAVNRLFTGDGYHQGNVEVSPFLVQAPFLG